VSQPTRRGVRTIEDFWVSLDTALPSGSEPSWHAFAAYDLPRAVERFATEWETLPALIPGRPDYRLLIGNGTVVAVYAIEAQLASDGTVELVNITVHTAGLPASDEDLG
jgi:hypothetical protein